MAIIKKRLEFSCWNCGKSYTLYREFAEGKPTLSVACPYCRQEGVVDLSPYSSHVDTIFKGGNPCGNPAGKEKTHDEQSLTRVTLPPILPTRQKAGHEGREIEDK